MAAEKICNLSIVFVISIFLHDASGQEIPSITQIIWPEVKKHGTTGYLNCTVNRQNLNKVFWIREGISKSESLIITSDDRVVVDEGINELVDGYPKYDVTKRGSLDTQMTYTLIVRRLIYSDMGNYTCQIIVTGSHERPTKTGQIFVMIPPAINRGEFELTVNVEQGGDVNLSCSATGYPAPNISWCRVNGNPLPPPHNRFMWMGPVLPLTNIQPPDRAIYRCVANNEVRPMNTYDTTVYVHFTPVVSLVQDSYGQAANRQFDLTMYCVVEGFPTPEMNWYKEEGNTLTRIIDDDRHNIDQMQNHGQIFMISSMYSHLTIINVKANDYGYYVCEGRNRMGAGQARILVYETSECQGPNCPVEGGTQGGGAAGVLTFSHQKLLQSLVVTSMFTNYYLSQR